MPIRIPGSSGFKIPPQIRKAAAQTVNTVFDFASRMRLRSSFWVPRAYLNFTAALNAFIFGGVTYRTQSIFARIMNPQRRLEGAKDKKVRIQVADEQFSFSMSTFPKEVQKMSVEKRGDFFEKIGEKISGGKELYEDIKSGKGPEKASIKDITDLSWFLQAQGEAKAGTFTSGAFTIEDPEGHLGKFLDSCEEMYQRKSTHLKGFQNLAGGAPKGIDVTFKISADNTDALLPHGKRTMLFQNIAESTDLHMPQRMIYIKLEEFGARGSQKTDVEGTSASQKTEADREALLHFIGHTITTIQSLVRRIRGAKTGGGMRKERVPKDFKQAAKQAAATANEAIDAHAINFLGDEYSDLKEAIEGRGLIAVLEDEAFAGHAGIGVLKGQGYERALELFGSAAPIKQGVRVFCDYLEEVRGLDFVKNDTELSQVLEQIDKEFTGLAKNLKWDHLELRFGNEVIFTEGDLA